MDRGEPRGGGPRGRSKLPVWIIEHVWTHKMMDVQQVVDPSCWPDVDSQPLSLEDGWRLRVVSAQVYSIVKSRDLEHFERVIGFLETTYRLVPTLVAAIKHMKVLFGLKTMVIMWMLREGRGMIDTVSKTVRFFPSKLPEYQDRCSQHEMLLMRRNHLDFRTLAQTLAVDRARRDAYIKNEMEEQYGERYAQKAEARLLQYLHELDAVLQGDTYIDKILKKQSPVTEEEKLLLDVITSDPVTIATTLKQLLHCDAASCRGSRSQPAPHGRSSEAPESQTPPDIQPEEFRGDQEDPQHGSKDSSSLLVSGSCVGGHQCSEEAAPTPQFCSKHQRWVESILQQCSDECSEELLLQADASSSPLLFQSSSSTSSSQDFTPSDLVPPDGPPSQTPGPPQASSPGGSPRSSRDGSHTKALPEASSSGPALLVPLADICSPNTPQALAASSRAEMLSSPHSGSSVDGTTNSSSARCPTPRSRQLRQVCTDHQLSEGFSQRFEVPTFQVGLPPTASDCAASGIPSSSTSCKEVPQSSTRCRRDPGKRTRPQSEASSSASRRSRTRRGAELKLSLPSQAVLLQSRLLQPCVSLTRLSSQQCDLWTQRRVTACLKEPEEQGSSSEEEDTQVSFDVNTLYTTSSSDGGQSPDGDPDYRPHMSKKALLLEYETARMLGGDVHEF